MGEENERTYSTQETTRILMVHTEIEETVRELSMAANEALRGRGWEGIDRIVQFINQIKLEVFELGHFMLKDKLKDLERDLHHYNQIKPKEEDELHLFPRIDDNVFSMPYYRNNGFPK